MSVVNNNSQKECVFDNFSHFIFSIFPWFYCFHSAKKIKQMADPDNCKTDPARRHPAHQNESHRHHDSHHSNDPQLCPHCHCPLLHKAVQMLSVKPCPDKPVMKSSGAFCKAEYSRHIEGHCRKDRQHNARRTESQTEESQQDPENAQWIILIHFCHPFLITSLSRRPQPVSHSQHEFLSLESSHSEGDSVELPDTFCRNDLIRAAFSSHMSVLQTDDPV